MKGNGDNCNQVFNLPSLQFQSMPRQIANRGWSVPTKVFRVQMRVQERDFGIARVKRVWQERRTQESGRQWQADNKNECNKKSKRECVGGSEAGPGDQTDGRETSGREEATAQSRARRGLQLAMVTVSRSKGTSVNQ